nr:VapC toxin family PIN domain ribonuclease [Sphingomonas insulae]
MALRDITAQGGRLRVGDLILTEVLQGTRSARNFQRTLAWMMEFDAIPIADHRVAVEAARHYRHLRALGITIRKTIDTLIATRCILDRLPLLYSDRDFDPFVQHLGLRSALVTPE